MISEGEVIEGVLYALPKIVIDRFFLNRKTVFIKYTAHKHSKKSKNRLSKGMKLFFYQSRSNNSVVGEALIKAVCFLNYEEIIKKFPSKIMLSKEELSDYSNNRTEKLALVLELEHIEKYDKIKKVKKPVTMGGIYVTNVNKRKLFLDKGRNK